MKNLISLLGISIVFAGALSAQPPPAASAPGTTLGNYVLTPLDSLEFRIYGEPDTDTTVQISASGLVSLPYLETTVKLSGLTLQQARETLYREYERDLYVNPQIFLGITRFAERRIQVVGEVANPGILYMPAENSFTLIEAITAAGGFNVTADRQSVRITRAGPDGKMQVLTVDADKLLSNPELEKQWQLQKGDTIEVRYATNKVHVTGQVARTGDVLIPPDEGLTLLQAISAAGGFTRIAKSWEVSIRRIGENGKTVVETYDVSKIMRKEGRDDVPLRDGDYIFVPERIF